MESPLLPSGVLRPPRGGPSPTHGARSDAYTAPPMASQPPLLSIDITGLQVRSLRGGLGVLKLIPTHVCSWCRGVWSYLGPSRQHPMPPRPELRSYGAHGVQTTVTCTPIRTYHAGCDKLEAKPPDQDMSTDVSRELCSVHRAVECADVPKSRSA
jgi:hypothetical protein